MFNRFHQCIRTLIQSFHCRSRTLPMLGKCLSMIIVPFGIGCGEFIPSHHDEQTEDVVECIRYRPLWQRIPYYRWQTLVSHAFSISIFKKSYINQNTEHRQCKRNNLTPNAIAPWGIIFVKISPIFRNDQKTVFLLRIS